MSTEHQKYSIANQVDAISAYAAAHDLVIIRTYIDEAKSGLSLSGRVSLKCLLDDVQSGRADFNTVLVYDVSRWGRFQDADESAYYEYTHDGVTVPDQPLAPSAVWPTSTTETSRDCAWADLDLPACRTTAWSPKHVTHAEFLPPAELNGKGCRRFPHEPGGLASHLIGRGDFAKHAPPIVLRWMLLPVGSTDRAYSGPLGVHGPGPKKHIPAGSKPLRVLRIDR